LFPNPEDILRPGMYAKIHVATDVLKEKLLVPQAAVLETQGQYQVAVVDANNKVSLRTVKMGKQVGKLRLIDEGVAPGERVIVEGLQKVSDGMEVKTRLAAAEPAPSQASAPEPTPAAASNSAPIKSQN
jgi:membrane fusion protein (multidrug efflux system)